MKILKYPLVIADNQIVRMPSSAVILDAQVQHGTICLWALCDEAAPVVSRHIALQCTGSRLPDWPGWYIATVQLNGGDLVCHVFDLEQQP